MQCINIIKLDELIQLNRVYSGRVQRTITLCSETNRRLIDHVVSCWPSVLLVSMTTKVVISIPGLFGMSGVAHNKTMEVQ